MDGLVAVGVVVAGALVAWRWWLDTKTRLATFAHARGADESAATRAHELELRKQVVAVDQKTLDGLAGRMTAVEEQVKTLGWKRA